MRKWLALGFVLALGCGGGGDDSPDTGVAVDGSSAGNPGFAGCGTSAAQFVDKTGATDSRQMAVVAAGASFTYSPKCMRVKLGQTVSIESSNFHPIQIKPGNPGTELTEQLTTVTATLNHLGVYAFYCGNHGTPSGAGLSGAIEVVP